MAVSSTTSLVSATNPSFFGQSVTFTATVTPGATGTVSFFDGGTPMGTAALAGGMATLSTSSLIRANHSITAVYSGDAGFDSSTSNTVNQEVNHSGSSGSISSSTPLTVFGQPVTFTATITAQPPGAGTPTGLVTFFVDDVSAGIVALAGGAANLTTSALSVGGHIIKIGYAGDNNFNPAAADLFPHTVAQASTTTAVVSSANPSVFGQSVTFTATVSPVAPGAGTATGTVTFTIDAVPQAPVALVAGVATFTTNSLPVGPHAIGATYSGSASHAASSGNVAQTVNKSSSTTTVTSAPNPTNFGSSVTLTATVAVTAPGSGTPTGTVTFFDGATSLGAVALAGGQATLSTSALTPGPHSITAVYGSDANFNGSTSAIHSHSVNPAPSTTTVVSSLNPSTFGQSVTFTTTVTSAASGTPTGTVTFRDGATVLGTASLNGAGQASFSTSTLASGSRSITATYAGDATFATSTGTLTQTVNQSATTTALGSAANPSVFGQAVTFTATVAPVAPGAGTPTGTVTFRDGATTLGTGTLNGAGQATFSTTTLAVGSHSITATYNADANFTTSTSPVTGQTVNKAATSSALVSSVNPSVFGQSVTLTATVAATAPGAGTPTGTVTFRDGATILGTAVLAGGQAALATSALSVGAHATTATYEGDGNFTTSLSNTVNQTVSAAATSTALASSANPSNFGQTVTFTATVSATAPGAGTPTGTVTFRDGATVLGTSALNASRQGSVTTSALTGGAHSITATYNADANFAASTSAPLAQTVNQAATSTTTLAPVGGPVTAGTPGTFSATVTSAAGTPTGTVTFRDGATVLGTALLNASGVASAQYPMTIGSHTITASYNGDTNFAVSTSAAATFTVNPVETRVSTPVVRSGALIGGELLTIAATVTSDRPVTGTITFRDGGTVLGNVAVDGQGTAILSARLAIGAHTIVATYEGDVVHARSTSEPLFLTIRGTATLRLVSSANPSAAGAAVTFTATLTAPQTGAPAPAGTVTFMDGARTIGTVTVTSGQAAINASDLTSGEHSIVASYSGDANYVTSSATLTHRVDAGASTTALDAGVDANGYYLTATVTPPAAGGAVQFEDADTAAVLGSATLANGSAMLRLAAPLPVGRSLRAVYAGDTAHGGSRSAAFPFIAVANAFSFSSAAFAGESILSIFGASFVDATVAATSATLPQTLGGATVRIVDAAGQSHSAGLYFVSAGQINFVLPASVPAGPARLVVTNARGSYSLSLTVVRVGPSFATADGSGSGNAAAHLVRVHQDGTQDPIMTVSAQAIPFGAATDSLYLILYGTGFRRAQGSMSCSMNGQTVSAMYAGAHSTYTGLDQVNLQLPNSLRGAGRVTINCTIDGQTTNTVTINVQ